MIENTQWDIRIIMLLAVTLLVQSIFLFRDAQKRGSYKWFWGIWGLLQFPMPTLFYFLFVRWPQYRKQNKRSV
ncbi:transcriptional regulator [Halalkalibacter sp. APA_J-10(15)]|uniref:transcriptional regulator n=1 Tax=unclassified Halalkalibacter TaxID=2893063 RepID=UPI001FF1D2CF|nr:transcriptional regulator [Halalkalibacter sp. APA_J-10(15)]MCK0473062.1 transcriptional regulator [Halalkalibacter sp. APA_J-10(15)]